MRAASETETPVEERARRRRDDSPSARDRRGSGSIKTTWTKAVALFIVIMVAIGGGGLGFMRQQGRDYDRTATYFARELGLLSELQRATLTTSLRLGVIVYELHNRTATPEQEWVQLQAETAKIASYYDALLAMTTGPESKVIQEAQVTWRRVIEGAAAGKAMWGTGEVQASMAKGIDPFGPTVWAPISATEISLATASVVAADQLRLEKDRAAHREAVVQMLCALALAVVVVISVLSIRQFSRRLVRPLISLQGAVSRARDGVLDEPTQLPKTACRELVDLAGAMADMTVTLNATQARLHNQAYTDGLTGLANRRAFEDALANVFGHADVGQAAVLLIDIDDFKDVNDSMGHAAGDELLVALGDRLRNVARAEDTVSRIGGDEFAIVVPSDDALGTATLIAERILATLEEPVLIDGAAVAVRCSIGIADNHGVGTAEGLVQHADAAMYVAKSRGKRCFERYDVTLHATIAARADVEKDARQAVGQR